MKIKSEYRLTKKQIKEIGKYFPNLLETYFSTENIIRLIKKYDEGKKESDCKFYTYSETYDDILNEGTLFSIGYWILTDLYITYDETDGYSITLEGDGPCLYNWNSKNPTVLELAMIENDSVFYPMPSDLCVELVKAL